MGRGTDTFGARSTLETAEGTVEYYSLARLAEDAGVDLQTLPMTVKVLLENVLRLSAEGAAERDDVLALARWKPQGNARREFPFLPARVLLQDFTGVPAVVDLAAMRAAMARLHGDAEKINPLAPS